MGASSAPAAGWKGLLSAGIEACENLRGQLLPHRWAERQREALDHGDMDELLGVAEIVSRKLGASRGGEFRRWLRETVGALQVKSSGVVEALAALQAPLVTTNYDSILEDVTGRRTLTWRQDNQVTRLATSNQWLLSILHLHGHWEDSESIILGIRSYDAVIGHEHTQSTLRALLMSHSAVFVGYGDGLEDPNFGALRAWAARVLEGTEHRHYRLCLSSEAEKLGRAHFGERIIPLSYGNQHDDLEPFLRSLHPPDARLPSHGGGSASKRTTKRLPPKARAARTSSKQQVILFTAANPQGHGPLQLSEESAAIERRLAASKHPRDFAFVLRWIVNIDDLMRQLVELNPTVIHFSGHGDPRDGLLLQDEFSRPQSVSGRALAMLIESAAPHVRLVVLNGCYSSALADALCDNVDCVIGMAAWISDREASVVADQFYAALAARRSVHQAAAQANGVLGLMRGGEHGVALLHCVTRNGVDADDLFLHRPRPIVRT